MSSLFWETVSPDMRSNLGGFSQSEIGVKYCLGEFGLPCTQRPYRVLWL
jgi:hypothetical protein